MANISKAHTIMAPSKLLSVGVLTLAMAFSVACCRPNYGPAPAGGEDTSTPSAIPYAATSDRATGDHLLGSVIGDKMPDGTVYAGVSPDTNKPMYATPEDAPQTFEFFGATGYAAKLEADGHRDWHVPSKSELNVLFNNRAAIGGFNSSKWGLSSEYWSASQVKLQPPNDDSFASSQNFSDGFQSTNHKFSDLALRCVR